MLPASSVMPSAAPAAAALNSRSDVRSLSKARNKNSTTSGSHAIASMMFGHGATLMNPPNAKHVAATVDDNLPSFKYLASANIQIAASQWEKTKNSLNARSESKPLESNGSRYSASLNG